MRKAFVGVDVAFAKKKYLPVSVCVRQDGRLIPLPLKGGPVAPPRGSGNVATLDRSVVRRFARDVADYIKAVASWQHLEIARIAIDAPRDYRLEDTPRRSAELAMDTAGISCYATPSSRDFTRIKRKVKAHLIEGGSEGRLPHANQLWMLVGFALFQELANIVECLEVFPQATVRVIGAGQTHKFKREGLEAQVAAAATFTGWSSVARFRSALDLSGYGATHDKLDAYLSAWVASLDESDRVALGTLPDDVIWIPRTSDSENFEVRRSARSRPEKTLPFEGEAPAGFPLSPRFGEALALAAKLHTGQYRKGTSIPYVAHLLGVASLALDYGGTEDEAIAALLHDAVEDQGGERTAKLIHRRFGRVVADIVEGCSDTDVVPKPPWKERKVVYLRHLRDASLSIRFVSACDKLHNLRAILSDYKSEGEGLWQRFNGKKDGTLWYYRSLVREFGRNSKQVSGLLLVLRETLDELESLVG